MSESVKLLGDVSTGRFVLRYEKSGDKIKPFYKLQIVWRGENIKQMMSEAAREGLKFIDDDTKTFGGYFVDENGDTYFPDVD